MGRTTGSLFQASATAICAAVAVSLLLSTGCIDWTNPFQRPAPQKPAPPPPPPEMRAVWVTRWDYNDADDIKRIMEESRQLGMNTVLFQVRGSADAYYESRIEPRAESLKDGDPGFDPLAVAIREARVRGMKLHAWVNVMPMWRGVEPPKNPNHVFYRHPEWRLYDQQGQPQPLDKHYVVFNPCLPEVRQYLAAVMGDIVRRYPVDGLHLDYIRWVSETMEPGMDYSYDAKTVALYAQATGRPPRLGDPAWNRWREAQIDAVVAEIKKSVMTQRPNVEVTAAVFADRKVARAQYFQNGELWLARRWVDAVMPMIYRDNTEEFVKLLRDWEAHSAGRAVVAGIGTYKHNDPAITQQQVKLARMRGDGFALFSYGAMTSTPPEGVSSQDVRRFLVAAY